MVTSLVEASVRAEIERQVALRLDQAGQRPLSEREIELITTPIVRQAVESALSRLLPARNGHTATADESHAGEISHLPVDDGSEVVNERPAQANGVVTSGEQLPCDELNALGTPWSSAAFYDMYDDANNSAEQASDEETVLRTPVLIGAASSGMLGRPVPFSMLQSDPADRRPPMPPASGAAPEPLPQPIASTLLRLTRELRGSITARPPSGLPPTFHPSASMFPTERRSEHVAPPLNPAPAPVHPGAEPARGQAMPSTPPARPASRPTVWTPRPVRRPPLLPAQPTPATAQPPELPAEAAVTERLPLPLAERPTAPSLPPTPPAGPAVAPTPEPSARQTSPAPERDAPTFTLPPTPVEETVTWPSLAPAAPDAETVRWGPVQTPTAVVEDERPPARRIQLETRFADAPPSDFDSGFLGEGGTYEVLISPFTKFSQVGAFTRAVAAIPGVRRAQTRQFFKGTLHLKILYEGDVPLAERLTELASFQPRIAATNGNRVEVRVSPLDGPGGQADRRGG
jgi:hypothetical protein